MYETFCAPPAGVNVSSGSSDTLPASARCDETDDKNQ